LLIHPLIATGEVTLTTLQIDQRSSLRGHIAGVLRFEDSSELHFREFVDTSRSSPRLMYAYHYQGIDKALIFRYDNAASAYVMPPTVISCPSPSTGTHHLAWTSRTRQGWRKS